MWSQNRDDCSPDRLVLQIATATNQIADILEKVGSDIVKLRRIEKHLRIKPKK